MYSEMCSGLIGAVVAVVVTKLCEIGVYYFRRRSLIEGIKVECDYNLSIVDEVLKGSVERMGSFKRLSVEYFKTIREAAVRYALKRELLFQLSRVIVNVELYNKEADYVFDHNGVECAYAGVLSGDPVLISKEVKARDITSTMEAACVGVKESLIDLKNLCK